MMITLNTERLSGYFRDVPLAEFEGASHAEANLREELVEITYTESPLDPRRLSQIDHGSNSFASLCLESEGPIVG